MAGQWTIVTSGATMTRHNNFNLLRLILALLVILSHSPELIDGNRHREILTQLFGSISFGELAVDLFFLLSGYLIMQSWDREPAAIPFIRKRVLRIYPGFLVASIVCAAIVGPLGSTAPDYLAEFDLVAFLLNAVLLQVPAVPEVFAGQPYPLVNGALWTISREFACYLLVLALGTLGILRRRHAWLALTLAATAAFSILKIKNAEVPDVLRLLVFFLSGASFYLYRDSIPINGRYAAVLSVPLLTGLCSWRGAELALATCGAYVVLYLAQRRIKVVSGFNLLPDMSYGIYLYGWPVQKLLVWYIPAISPWSLFVVASLMAAVLGYLSWHLVEKPMLKLKQPARQATEPSSVPTI